MHDISLMVIGQRLHRRRMQLKRTLDEVARAAGLSASLISKIENFRTMPSLPVLVRLSEALETDMAEFVTGLAARQAPGSYILMPRAERMPVEREEAQGFRYESIFSKELDRCFWQTVILTLEPAAKRLPATTDGDEFLLVLGGRCEFRLGMETITMAEGDAIFFDGRVPHVPTNPGPGPTTLFVAYFLTPTQAE